MEIFCNINPFIYKQKIYKINQETEESKLLELCRFGDLEETILKWLEIEQLNTLHLDGDLKFILDIGHKIETKYNLNYSYGLNNNLTVLYN